MPAVIPRRREQLTCVILAAGGSSRLGTAKQVLRYRGRALLRRAVDAASRALPTRPIVVVGADSLRMRALLRRSHPSCIVAVNPYWRSGLASSLRIGLAAVPRRTRAALFLLADQPLIDAASLERLVAAWSRHPSRAAAARYGGRLGVPAVLPRRTWPRLRALQGDIGARGVLESEPVVTAIDMPEAAADVDTREDFARLGAWPSRGLTG